MVDVGKTIDRADGFQQRHAWAAIPFGIYKKFGEDQAGNLAALISYYAFFSIFPLLLALTTILGYVLAGNAALQKKIFSSALGSFPIISSSSSVKPLTGNVFALVIGLGLALWSGLAVAQQAQTAFNVVWNVPRVDRPGFLPRLLRSLELVVVVGGGLIVTTLVQGFLSGTSKYGLDLGYGLVVLGAVVGIVLNVGLLMLLFNRGTGRDLTWRAVFPGAVVGGIGWFVLQKVGTHLVNSKVSGASGTYGTFAVVIGLLSYFYLLAQVTLYASEVNVVLADRLWPRGIRSLAGKATTEADERAYSAYPERERQAHGTDVDVDVDRASESDGTLAGKPADRDDTGPDGGFTPARDARDGEPTDAAVFRDDARTTITDTAADRAAGTRAGTTTDRPRVGGKRVAGALGAVGVVGVLGRLRRRRRLH